MLSYSDQQRLFSRDVLLSLAEQKKNEWYDTVASDLRESSGLKLYNGIYSDLIKNYRSDFVFRSIIAQKLFISRHSLDKSALLNELRIGQARADMVILNGSSTAYEIKSDFDNFERLSNQLSEYLKAIDNVYVVVSQRKQDYALKTVDTRIGVIVLTQNNSLKTVKKAVSNKCNVLPSVIFDTLRKEEYSRIILKEFGHVPKVPNTRFFTECKSLFCTLTPDKAHDLFVLELKNRVHYTSVFRSVILRYPKSLRYSILNAGLTDEQNIRLCAVLLGNKEGECTFHI